MQIVEWIRKEVKKAGAKGVVVGMSGGMDSSVTAVLCKLAFPEESLGLIMPCLSGPKDLEHAALVAKKFKIKTKVIELTPVYEKMIEGLDGNGIAAANLKARLRMAVLYYFANKLRCLVAGTGNRSELSVGYFTKYGDGGCDILPIGGLLKTQVKKLAKRLGMPEEIIQKAPSAGLWRGQTDESELGVTYEQLDGFLSTGKGSAKIKRRIKELIRKSEHKRRLPAVCLKK